MDGFVRVAAQIAAGLAPPELHDAIVRAAHADGTIDPAALRQQLAMGAAPGPSVLKFLDALQRIATGTTSSTDSVRAAALQLREQIAAGRAKKRDAAKAARAAAEREAEPPPAPPPPVPPSPVKEPDPAPSPVEASAAQVPVAATSVAAATVPAPVAPAAPSPPATQAPTAPPAPPPSPVSAPAPAKAPASNAMRREVIETLEQAGVLVLDSSATAITGTCAMVVGSADGDQLKRLAALTAHSPYRIAIVTLPEANGSADVFEDNGASLVRDAQSVIANPQTVVNAIEDWQSVDRKIAKACGLAKFELPSQEWRQFAQTFVDRPVAKRLHFIGETDANALGFARFVHYLDPSAKESQVVIGDAAKLDGQACREFIYGQLGKHNSAFEKAKGGLVIINNVDGVPAGEDFKFQSNLAIVLNKETPKFRPINGTKEDAIAFQDARIISCSRTDIRDVVRAGRFSPTLAKALTTECHHLPGA